jgi:hypothetical protein
MLFRPAQFAYQKPNRKTAQKTPAPPALASAALSAVGKRRGGTAQPGGPASDFGFIAGISVTRYSQIIGQGNRMRRYV